MLSDIYFFPEEECHSLRDYESEFPAVSGYWILHLLLPLCHSFLHFSSGPGDDSDATAEPD